MKYSITSNWLFAVSLIDLLGSSLFIPLFGMHLRTLGMSHFNIGVISSTYHGAQLLSSPIIGSWSDKHGRKNILLFSLTICAVCYCLIGFISSFIIMLTFRLILGTLKHTQSLFKALVADVMPPNEQTMSYGKLNAVTSFGFMIGPFIGGHIFEMNNGFRIACIVVCCIFLLNSLIIWIYIPKTQNKNRSEYKNLVSKTSTSFNKLLILNWKNCWDILLLKFAFSFCTSLYYSIYIATIHEKFDLTQKYIGYTISFQGLMASGFSVIAGKFDKLHNTSKIKQLFYSFLIFSLSLLCLGFAQNYSMFIFGVTFLQASTAFIRVITTERLLVRSSPKLRGSIIGTSSSVNSVSKLFGPVISGFIADKFDLSYNSILSSVIAFITCLMCLLMTRGKKEI